MYDVINNVIASKRYELKDILSKIDTLWVQSSITNSVQALFCTRRTMHRQKIALMC